MKPFQQREKEEEFFTCETLTQNYINLIEMRAEFTPANQLAQHSTAQCSVRNILNCLQTFAVNSNLSKHVHFILGKHSWVYIIKFRIRRVFRNCFGVIDLNCVP